MNYTLTKRLFICWAIGFFSVSAIFTIGCAAKKIKVVYEKDGNSEYSEEGHKHKKGGPPPYAPAHGYRAKHQYRYYPSCSIYYDTGRRLYFYLKGDNWEVGASLPSKLKVGLGESVTLELETTKPYLHHAEHAEKYRPKTHKNKKNKHGKWG